jgi:hypothetical protein
MKALIAIVIIVGAGFLGWKLFEQWNDAKAAEEQKNPAATQPAATVPSPSGSELSGMPSQLQGQLDAAYRRGTIGLRDFLTVYGKSLQDPRKGWIQLDYVVLVTHENPAEAKRVFAQVKQRTLQSSPIYARVKQLEKTYE